MATIVQIWFYTASLYFKFQLFSSPNGYDIGIWKFKKKCDRQTENREKRGTDRETIYRDPSNHRTDRTPG